MARSKLTRAMNRASRRTVRERKKLRRTRKPYAPGQLKKELARLKSRFARAAQRVLDGYDPERYGGGGICDDVASAMADVAAMTLHDVDVDLHGWDDHAWIVVWNQHEAWSVDIPPSVYETGGGYSWTVDVGAKIRPNHVVFQKVRLRDWLG